jgi:hypothetical protein
VEGWIKAVFVDKKFYSSGAVAAAAEAEAVSGVDTELLGLGHERYPDPHVRRPTRLLDETCRP